MFWELSHFAINKSHNTQQKREKIYKGTILYILKVIKKTLTLKTYLFQKPAGGLPTGPNKRPAALLQPLLPLPSHCPHTHPTTTHFPFPAGHNTAPQPRPHPPCTQPISQDSLHSPSLSLYLHLPRNGSLSQNPSRSSPTDFSFFFFIVDHNRFSLIGTDRPPSISFTVSCSSTVLTGDPLASRTTAASTTAAATNRREDHQHLDHHRSSLYNHQIGRLKKEKTTSREEERRQRFTDLKKGKI